MLSLLKMAQRDVVGATGGGEVYQAVERVLSGAVDKVLSRFKAGTSSLASRSEDGSNSGYSRGQEDRSRGEGHRRRRFTPPPPPDDDDDDFYTDYRLKPTGSSK